MRLLHNPSIKETLVRISLMTTGVVLLLQSVILIGNQFISFRQALLETLTVQAKMISSNSMVALAFDNKKDAAEILGALSSAPNIVHAYIYKNDGAVFVTFSRKGSSAKAEPLPVPLYHYSFGMNRLSLYEPIMLGGERVGVIHLESDLQDMYGKLLLFSAITLVVLAAAFFIAFLMLSKLQGRITAPIRDLANLTAAVSKDRDYSMRAPVNDIEELRALAAGFNEMLSQIQQRDLQLAKNREQLEDKVMTRTAELAHANEQLQAELVERNRAEAKLQQNAAELKQSNDDLKSLNFIFFHDLRTPLVNLKGFSGELRTALTIVTDSLAASFAAAQKEDQILQKALATDIPEALEFIDSSVERISTLINSVLQLNHLGRALLKPVWVDLDKLLASVVANHQQAIARRDIVFDIAPLPAIIVDRPAIELIIGHLMENAVKYLCVDRPGRIAVTAEPGDETITFRIRDNGRGIEPEDLEKIFDIFRRAGVQDTAGEGMGLAYVKTLVQRLGGRICCESQPGVGSTFSFSIAAAVRQG